MKKSKKIVIKNDETSVIDELNNASYVYGPPVYMGWKITNPYYDKPVTESATESETTTTEISAEEYIPQTEQGQYVYGPPPYCMKKSKKTVLTALILTSAVNMASCDLFSDDIQDVYGPPVDMSSEVPMTEYDPYYEEPQPEYGVPVDEPLTESATMTTENDIEKYIPQREQGQNVYGPPPDLD